MAKHDTVQSIREIQSKLLEICGQVFTSSHQRKKALAAIHELTADLEKAIRHVDDISLPVTSINPSTPTFIGRVISSCLLEQEAFPMGKAADKRFYGSGIYAIFYTGDFKPYQPLSKKKQPIYVGKADPKKRDALVPREQGTVLWRRLYEHAANIDRARNLELKDFTCRHLVVGSGWEGAAEDFLIDIFKPIWNKQVKVCYGFGKHGDAAKTRGNRRSPWDTLHPGRAWATSSENKPSKLLEAQIIEKIAAHFVRHPPLNKSLTITDVITGHDE